MNSSPTQWTLHLNGQPITPADDFFIHPGQPNTLTIQSGKGAQPTAARLVRTLPDGSRCEQEIPLPAATAHTFELGPMTAPNSYQFAAGAVYIRGHQIELSLSHQTSGRILLRGKWGQAPLEERTSWRIWPGKPAPTISAGALRFESGAERCQVYNPKGAVESTLDLRLDPAVLTDCHAVTAMVRLNPGALVDEITARIVARSTDQKLVAEIPLTVMRSDDWQRIELPAADWPEGDYTIALYPELAGKVWPEGPQVAYHKQATDPQVISISPYAPFTLERDPERTPITISDFGALLQDSSNPIPSGWELTPDGAAVAVVTEATQCPDPLDLPVSASGLHAVFATPAANGCFIQIGTDGLIRPIPGPLPANENNGALAAAFGPEVFIAVADLSGSTIRLIGPDRQEPETLALRGGADRRSPAQEDRQVPATLGLRGLRLEPVTTSSVTAFHDATRNIPLPLSGINDWGCYFHGRDGFIPPRMQPDQYDTIVGAQAEVGIHTIAWSIGRSSLQYHSSIPGYPITHIGPADVDPLNAMLAACRKFGSEPQGWFALMYYGKTRAVERTEFFQNHPEFRRWRKNATAPDSGEPAGQLMSYYFPEVRANKVQPLVEVAERGAQSLLLCAIRLAPLMDYHPEMVAAYREAFGIDPNTISDSTSSEFYHWIQWRADFFTQLLRELRQALQPVEKIRRQRIPVGMRIPSSGLFYNLAEGMDVKQWLEEGLIDFLNVAGLESLAGPNCNSHDIQPYLNLGKDFDVPVFGAIGATWCRTPDAIATALRRVHGMLSAGVNGIEVYESEVMARCSQHRWTAPLFGNPKALKTFIESSNLEACYPITASTCLYGYDNHCRWWTDKHWTWHLDGQGPDRL